MNQNWGRGQWRRRGRGFRGGSFVGSSGQKPGGNHGRGGRSVQSSQWVNFDPLACYHCGVHGHLARDCPQVVQSQGSGNVVPSHGNCSKSGQKGPRGRGCGWPVRFSGMNVLYDEAGNEYPVDDAGQLYVPLGFEQTVAEGETKVENTKETKN